MKKKSFLFANPLSVLISLISLFVFATFNGCEPGVPPPPCFTGSYQDLRLNVDFASPSFASVSPPFVSSSIDYGESSTDLCVHEVRVEVIHQNCGSYFGYTTGDPDFNTDTKVNDLEIGEDYIILKDLPLQSDHAYIINVEYTTSTKNKIYFTDATEDKRIYYQKSIYEAGSTLINNRITGHQIWMEWRSNNSVSQGGEFCDDWNSVTW